MHCGFPMSLMTSWRPQSLGGITGTCHSSIHFFMLWTTHNLSLLSHQECSKGSWPSNPGCSPVMAKGDVLTGYGTAPFQPQGRRTSPSQTLRHSNLPFIVPAFHDTQGTDMKWIIAYFVGSSSRIGVTIALTVCDQTGLSSPCLPSTFPL